MILHIIDTTGPGGAETIFTKLAELSHSSRLSSIALIRGPGWVQQELGRLNIETIVYDCKGSFNLSYLQFLMKLIKDRNISLIQSHLLGSNVYASLAGLLTRTPVVSTFHGHVDIAPDERFKLLKFLLVRMGSNHIIAVTEEIRGVLSKLFSGLLKSKVSVIPNGIDDKVFSSSRNTPRKLEQKILIGCLGNVRKAKNYALALEFVKKLTDENYDVHLKIAGDNKNSLGDHLSSMAQKLEIEDRIEFCGFIDNTPDFLNQLDLFLMTSSSEGHPLALTQALSCKVPVLSSPSGVEKIFSSDYIFVSDAHSADSLFRSFKELVNEEVKDVENRLNSGRKLIEETYSQKAMFNHYQALYRKLYE